MLTEREFERLWRQAAPLRIPEPRAADFALSHRHVRHSIRVDAPQSAALALFWQHGLAMAVSLSAVACVQIRRACVEIDPLPLTAPPSLFDARLAADPAAVEIGFACRVDVNRAGHGLLRVATQQIDTRGEALHLGHIDIQLDAGLATTLAELTHGPHPFAERLARLDAAVS